MKTSAKLLSLFLVLMMLFTAFPLTAFAAEKVEYIKELRLSTASTEEAAKQWLFDNGYTVLGTNLNKDTKKDPVFLGYKTTYDPNEAITDMSVMQMDGGYSFSEYTEALKEQQAEIEEMLNSFVVVIEEYVANFKAGNKNAIAAYDMMNRFVEDDSGKPLGEFLLTYSNDKEQLTKLFMQSNQNVLSYLNQMFVLACTDYDFDNNWLAQFSKANPYGYDPREYNDIALDIFAAWEDLRSELVVAERSFDGLQEFGSAADYRDAVGEEQMAEDLNCLNYYVTLAAYNYAGKPMVEFFMQDPDELDLEDLYPLIASLTPGQIECLKAVGFKPLIEYAIMEDTDVEKLADSFDELLESKGITGTYSVYSNVDRSLFNGEGIALTSQALRESASTGETSWYKGNIDKGLETTLITIAGVAAAIGAACVVRAAVIASKVQNAVTGFLTFAEEYSGWYTMAELAELYGMPSNYVSSTGLIARVAAGVCIGIALIALAVLIGLELYNHNHPTYSEIPRIIVDHVLTEDDDYYLNYYCVRDQDGEFGDMNAWSGQRWNALYYTTDKRAGDPILANSLIVKVKSNSPDNNAPYGVHYFGETAAANVNLYSARKLAPALYMFFNRDHSLSKTASTFSGGTVAMFTGIGAISGIALGSVGVIGAGKLKKKKEESVPEETKQSEDV